jgi:hypothetical protein
MAHQEVSEGTLTHEEIMYNYFMTRGVDFTKIELFRSAREHYKQALIYKADDPKATERIDFCNEQIRSDRKKVLVIVPFLLALIAAVIALNV